MWTVCSETGLKTFHKQHSMISRHNRVLFLLLEGPGLDS